MNINTTCKENCFEVILSGAFDYFTSEKKLVDILHQIVKQKYEAVLIDFRRVNGVIYRTQEQLLCMTASILIHRHYTLQGKRLLLAMIVPNYNHEAVRIALKNVTNLGVMLFLVENDKEAKQWLETSL